MDLKKLKKSGVWRIGLPVLLGLFLNSTMVFAGHEMHPGLVHVSGKDQANVLSLLEKKIGDRQLLEKARGKLLSLDEEHTRLIASLSERITNDRSAGADFAYLLIATLLILS